MKILIRSHFFEEMVSETRSWEAEKSRLTLQLKRTGIFSKLSMIHLQRRVVLEFKNYLNCNSTLLKLYVYPRASFRVLCDQLAFWKSSIFIANDRKLYFQREVEIFVTFLNFVKWIRHFNLLPIYWVVRLCEERTWIEPSIRSQLLKKSQMWPEGQ